MQRNKRRYHFNTSVKHGYGTTACNVADNLPIIIKTFIEKIGEANLFYLVFINLHFDFFLSPYVFIFICNYFIL